MGQDQEKAVAKARAQLSQALAECCRHYSVPADHISKLGESLANPPASVRDPADTGFEPLGSVQGSRKHYHEATERWRRRTARELIAAADESPGNERRERRELARHFSTKSRVSFPKGRAPVVNVPLVLWLIFSIEDALRRRFPYKTDSDSGEAGGPAFECLFAALCLEYYKLCIFQGGETEWHWMPMKATVADIVRLARSDAFTKELANGRLQCSATCVEKFPDQFELAVSRARSAGRQLPTTS
jgi:hypothetical protein